MVRSIVFQSILRKPAKQDRRKAVFALWAQARAGRVLPGLEDLASIFCDFQKQNIRKDMRHRSIKIGSNLRRNIT
jgi:hypothetical protein